MTFISPCFRELFILFVSDHDALHSNTAVTPQLPRTVGLGSSNPSLQTHLVSPV